jgi:hypothetical protein
MKQLIYLCLSACLMLASCNESDSGKSESDEPKTPEKTAESGKKIIDPELLSTLKPDGKQELILLGFHNDSLYTTIGFTHSDNKIVAHGELPYLATPKKDGWWFLQAASKKYDSYVNNDLEDEGPMILNRENYVVWYLEQDAKKLQAKLKKHQWYEADERPEVIADMEYFMENHCQIAYVTNKYVTINSSMGEYMGGAHPMNGSSEFTMPFERLTSAMKKDHEWLTSFNLNVGDFATKTIMGCFSKSEIQAVKDTLVKMGERGEFVDALSDEPMDPRMVDTDEMDVILRHINGAVRPVFQGYADAYYAESGDYQFTAEYAMNKPVCGNVVPANDLPQSLEGLCEATGAADFFVSPGNNIVVLLYHERIDFVKVSDGTLIHSEPYKNVGRVIMAEWATGDFCAEWQKKLFN